jgi:hypothetical protein
MSRGGRAHQIDADTKEQRHQARRLRLAVCPGTARVDRRKPATTEAIWESRERERGLGLGFERGSECGWWAELAGLVQPNHLVGLTSGPKGAIWCFDQGFSN